MLVIDCSHERASDLNASIAEFAQEKYGFEIPKEVEKSYIRGLYDRTLNMSDLSEDEVRDLEWLAEEAEKHINEVLTEEDQGNYVTVEDNSLFLECDEEI